MTCRISARAFALAAASAFAVATVAGPASAAPSGYADPAEVQVTSSIGLNVRNAPKAGGAIVDHLDDGDRLYVACRVRGQKIKNTDIWYLIGKYGPVNPGDGGRWISAAYVKRIGPDAEWCPGHGG